MLVRMYLLWLEDLYFQQEAELGFAIDGGTDLLLKTVGPFLRKLLSVECAKIWWEEEALHHFTPNFYAAIAEARSDA